MASVVVNEVCWKNERFDDGTGSLTSDWVELYNNGSSPVDVGGYALGKKKSFSGCGDKICLLPSYTLDPGEFLVVYFDKDLPPVTNWVETVVNGRTKRVPWMRSNVFSLGTAEVGETLYQDDVRLFDNTESHNRISNIKGENVGTVLDKNASYGSLWDGDVDTQGERSEEGWMVFSSATPWGANAGGFSMSAPVFSVAPGVYGRSPSVSVTCPDERAKVIYYTLDGTDPRTSPSRLSIVNGEAVVVDARAPATASSGASQTNAWIRTSPVELEEHVSGAGWRAPLAPVDRFSILRAVAVYGPGFSAETRGDYCIGDVFSRRALPIVSLTVDSDDFFSDARGIYVPGAVYAARGYGPNKWGKPNANYFADDAEVKAHFELLEADATSPVQSFDLGVSLMEGGERTLPQKALLCALRGSEYGTRDVTYGLFPELGVKTFKRFVLDNGGREWSGPLTDGVSTLLKDAVFHRIASGLELAVSAHRPVSLYVNGDYWGIHMLRESADKQFYATRYDLDADNVDVLEHEAGSSGSDVAVERVVGDKTAVADYEAFLKRLDETDITSEAGLAVATASMDITNYIDYVIAETFFANDDWPMENCVFWRAHTNELECTDAMGDGRWRWRLSELALAGKAKDGVQGAWRDMLAYISAKDMRDRGAPGFLVNRLWANVTFQELFIARYVALLDTVFHPSRTSAVIHDDAAQIAEDVERHYRRWGREFSKEQWSAAVESSLVDYLALRWTNSFEHLDAKFRLGGVGELALTCGTGGRLRVDDEVVEGKHWTGRRFAGRPVVVTAIPSEGTVFSEWSDGVRDPVRSVQVSPGGTVTLSAVFARSFVIHFEPNGASGVMASLNCLPDKVYNLPACGFVAPTGKVFGGWKGDDGKRYDDQIAIFNVVLPGKTLTLTAVWQ